MYVVSTYACVRPWLHPPLLVSTHSCVHLCLCSSCFCPPMLVSTYGYVHPCLCPPMLVSTYACVHP
ncbi:hypothetical protein Hamer_G003995 [Homarus americanus]|uniref:Uncharacterized protein n=1 Tax=Homarus americanus TaxID=6706 RepID=A0A8J5NJJ2_HOMAM|nr:hypothetical protein Hamer_G003995 [Homarus americanus]